MHCICILPCFHFGWRRGDVGGLIALDLLTVHLMQSTPASSWWQMCLNFRSVPIFPIHFSIFFNLKRNEWRVQCFGEWGSEPNGGIDPQREELGFFLGCPEPNVSSWFVKFGAPHLVRRGATCRNRNWVRVLFIIFFLESIYEFKRS